MACLNTATKGICQSVLFNKIAYCKFASPFFKELCINNVQFLNFYFDQKR